MFERARRPTASLCIALLAVNVIHCTRIAKQDPQTAIQPAAGTKAEHIVGVTLNDGREIRFDRHSPTFLRADTLEARVNKQTVNIAVADMQRVWVESTDKKRTTLAVIGVTVGLFAAVVAIAIATKESCPFVYSWDGTQYVFDGEPYGGAVTRGLERDDYSHLESLRPDSAGLYRLMVTNEVNETQYTNSMELMVIDHQPGARIEMDEWGKPHEVTNAIGPSSARDQDGRDLVSWLSAPDQKIWEPLPSVNPVSGVRQEIVLTYPKPRGATHARLIARAGTGLWGSHMIREILQLRGAEVTNWYAALDQGGPALDALRAWNVREELYVLKLDLDEAGTWNPRGLLPGGGPFLTETRVVPLDISRVSGDSLRLRIRPPSGFWALNSFEISYADAGQPIAVTTIAPMTGVTSDGRDVLPDLRTSDDKYYAMPTTGDHAFVSFVAPPSRAGAERSVFLHTRGYYRLHLPEKGSADQVALQRITDEHDAAARMAVESFAKRRVARLTAGTDN
jgi:hypothetical protein